MDRPLDIQAKTVLIVMTTVLVSVAAQAAFGDSDTWNKEVRQYWMLRDAGNHQEALRHAEAFLQRVMRRHPSNVFAVADALKCLAFSQTDIGKYRTALALIERAESVLPVANNPDDLRALSLQATRAQIYMMQDDNKQALPLIESLLKKTESIYGTNSLPVARVLDALALINKEMGEVEAAEANLDKGMKIMGAPSANNAELYSAMLITRAQIRIKQGLLKQAGLILAQADQVIDNLCKICAEEESANRLNTEALLHWESGNKEEATELLKEALVLIRAHYGDHHPKYAIQLYILAAMYYKQLMGEETVRTLLTAMQVLENLEEESPDLTIEVLDLLSAVYMESNHPDLAMPVLAELIVSLREHRGPLDASLREPTENIIKVLKQLGKIEDVALFEKYLRMLETPDAVPEDRTPKPGDSILRSVLAFQ